MNKEFCGCDGKEEFNASHFYIEIFEESERYIPVPKWLKPIIIIAMMKLFDYAIELGKAKGKRLEQIRHINWARSKGKEFFEIYCSENNIKIEQ